MLFGTPSLLSFQFLIVFYTCYIIMCVMFSEAHMTEDHGLSDGDNSIECAQSYEFILLPLTVNKELWGRGKE